jgi:soluble lytic murein transglycosylase-like protein
LINLKSLVEEVSKVYKIDSVLLSAIISVESGWNTKVMRYERGYKWLVRPPDYAHALGISYDTEVVMQMCSYGLCQIMGGKAREQGFKGYLTDLLDPEQNLIQGCIFLSALASKYGYEPDIISAYNQGSPRKTDGGLYLNQRYVDSVDTELRKMRVLV